MRMLFFLAHHKVWWKLMFCGLSFKVLHLSYRTICIVLASSYNLRSRVSLQSKNHPEMSDRVLCFIGVLFSVCLSSFYWCPLNLQVCFISRRYGKSTLGFQPYNVLIEIACRFAVSIFFVLPFKASHGNISMKLF